MNDSFSPIKALRDEEQNAHNNQEQQQEYKQAFDQERVVQNRDNHYSDSNEIKNQNSQICKETVKTVKRQPLKLKFKGIIISKVLGQIYRKNRKSLLHESIASIKNLKQRTTTFKRINLQDLQRRTMMVSLQILQYLISKYITKITKQSFDTLNSHQA